MKRKAGTVLTLAAPGLVENLLENHRQPAIVAINKILGIADEFTGRVAASFADRRLTPEGQAQQAAEATTSALALLGAFDADITALRGRADKMEAALRAKVAPKVGTEVSPDTLREIRDELRQLPPTERLNIYRTTDDPMVLAAIATAPHALGDKRADGSRRLEPFVDPQELSAAQMDRAEAGDPVAATALHGLRGFAEVIKLAANSVKKEIADASGVSV